jgi:hypothetical protein
MNVKGSFEAKATPDPSSDEVDGVSIGRVRVDKKFSGPLDATGKVDMIGARTKVEGSAGYAAVERISGSLEGKRGSFVVLHQGLMNRGELSLSVVIVPDSGTGELTGIRGKMAIRIEGGQHFYELDYELVR